MLLDEEEDVRRGEKREVNQEKMRQMSSGVKREETKGQLAMCKMRYEYRVYIKSRK